jgi:Tol biopolymer transport system component
MIFVIPAASILNSLGSSYSYKVLRETNMLYKHKTTVIFITLIMLVVASLSSCLPSLPSLPPGVRFLSDTGTDAASGLAWSPDSKTLAVARLKFTDGGDPPYPVESYIDLLDIEKLSSYTLEKTRSTEQSWPTAAFATITGICWSPKQNQIVFVRANSIWLVNLNNEQPPIRLGDGGACAWSKDGKTLAVIDFILSKDQTSFSVEPSKIYTLDVSTGVKQDIYSQPTRLDYSIAWASDSNRLAIIEIDKKYDLNILDLDSGKKTMPIPSCAISSPTWSPDETMLAVETQCLSSTYESRLAIIKADDGSILWKSSVFDPRVYSIDRLPVTWSPDGKTIAYAQNNGVYALDVNALLKNK